MLRVIECEDNTTYIEINGRRLIFRNGLFIGWYDPFLDEPLD